jgi:hypothetical protein
MNRLPDFRWRQSVSALLLAVALALPDVGAAKGHSGSHGGGAHHSHGKKRSREARSAFKRSHSCPSTGKTFGACPGYTIDHIRPLKRGGADAPSNMQWQTKAEAKQKDKWE